MKYLTNIFLTLIACGQHKNSENGYNVLVTEKGDTKWFLFKVLGNYDLHQREDYDSIIFDKLSQDQILESYLFGIKKRDSPINKYMTFRGLENSTFQDYTHPTAIFLSKEYHLDNFRIEVLQNYSDSTIAPISMHHLVCAIDNLTNDSLIFQQADFTLESNYVVFNLISYERKEIMLEMHDIMLRLIDKDDENYEAQHRPNKNGG